MNGGKDSRTSTGLMIGIGMMVAGVGAFMLSVFGGVIGITGPRDMMVLVGAGVVLFVGGILVVGALVGLGLLRERRADATGPVRIENGAWVQARFAMNGVGEMIFSEEHFDPWDEDVKLFVRIKYPDGRTDECSTSFEVWKQCGEGQVGIAQIQGNWLGQFTAQRRV